MDDDTLARVAKKVTRQFPEMEGAKPSIRKERTPTGQIQFVLTFRGKASLPGGRTMQRVVRVIVNDSGRVIKMSTSK